jgi:hypothetical protein
VSRASDLGLLVAGLGELSLEHPVALLALKRPRDGLGIFQTAG